MLEDENNENSRQTTLFGPCEKKPKKVVRKESSYSYNQ